MSKGARVRREGRSRAPVRSHKTPDAAVAKPSKVVVNFDLKGDFVNLKPNAVARSHGPAKPHRTP